MSTAIAPAGGAVGGAPQPSPAALRTVLIASLIGTTIEWYDFFLYATAASIVFNAPS